MNIRDLKYLIAVAKHQHFGMAAQACHVSQPTLSAQLKKLEEELEVKLFERNNKKVLITTAGTQLLEQAKIILREVDQLKSLAKQTKDPLTGSFRLGTIPTLGPYWLPQVLPKLKTKLPKIDFFLHEEKTETLLQMLKVGKLDAAILALPVPNENFITQPLFEEKFFAAVPAQHRLGNKKILKLEQLSDETLLLLDEGHCLRDQALEVCHMTRVTEKVEFRATSLETLRHMVAIGSGITLLPASAITTTVNSSLIRYIPFVKPAPFRSIAMIWRRTSVKNLCCEMIAKVVGC